MLVDKMKSDVIIKPMIVQVVLFEKKAGRKELRKIYERNQGSI